MPLASKKSPLTVSATSSVGVAELIVTVPVPTALLPAMTTVLSANCRRSKFRIVSTPSLNGVALLCVTMTVPPVPGNTVYSVESPL